MTIFGDLYRIVFYQPVMNLLVLLYNFIPGKDLGLAVIALTVLVRLVLLPFSVKTIRSQRAMQALQPKLKALQEEHKGDKEKIAKATMELYASERVNPLGSCLPLIIQLPVFLAIYHALRDGISQKLGLLYPFVANPGTVNATFLGFLNLATPSIPLAVVAGLSQYWQAKSLTPKPVAGAGTPDTSAMIQKQMVYLMPAMTVVIGAGLPAGLTLYWLVSNLVSIVQQWYLLRPARAAKS